MKYSITKAIFYLLVLFFCISIYLYLSTSYLPLDQQALFIWTLLGSIYLLVKLDKKKNHPVLRILILTLSAFITLRYLFWRATSTLVYTGPADFIAMSLLFIAELEVATVYLINMFSNIWPLHREIHPLPDDQSLWPTVDIYLPTYTEDTDIVRITATAAAQIDYPKDKINIYILDDGGTEQRRNDEVLCAGAHYRHRKLNKIANDLGIHYITREKNLKAKAGNINNAFKQTSGSIILILDCDHVPAQDILKNTLGWFFKDEKLALVQTPHFFINPDPVEKSLGSFRRAPSENEMFYRGIQPAIDLWNATFFCGSAALLRRTCLEEMGGLVGETIVEDCESSINMHAKGYRSVYIGRPMVCGLSPETFEDFLVQRSRWCQGMLQLAFLNNPTFKRGLSFGQRVCYSSFYMYWFFGFARCIFFVAPSLFLIFNIKMYHASLIEAMVYALPHLVCSLFIMRYIFGRFRWPLFSELYESLQSIFLLPAVLGVIENPKSPTFKVTPKGRNLDHDFLSPMAGPFYLLFIIMLISFPTAIYQWFENPLGRDGIIICLVWLTINIGITFSALGVFWERHQIRTYPRAWANNSVELYDHMGQKVAEGHLRDLSMSGAGAIVTGLENLQTGVSYYMVTKNSKGKKFSIYSELKFHKKTKNGEFCGLEFPFHDAIYDELVTLVYGDSQRWVDFWNRPAIQPSLMEISRLFLKMGSYGISHSVSGLKHLIVYNGIKLQHAWMHSLRAIVAVVEPGGAKPKRARGSTKDPAI